MNLRRSVQLLFLSLFFLLFFTARYPILGILPHDLFLRADPLAALVVLLIAQGALGTFLLATIVVASALLMGRVFCGYVCPLGTVQDGINRLGASGRDPTVPDQKWRGLKYGILVLSVISGLLGLSLLAWVDPLVLMTRSTAVLLDPWILALGNLGLEAVQPLAERMNWVGLANAVWPAPVYRLVGFSVILVCLIVGSSLLRSRLWCRYGCPLGALLGILGHWAPLRRWVTDECTACGACASACPMGAIGADGQIVRQSECLRCERCASVCPVGAIRFLPKLEKPHDNPAPDLSLSRRGLLIAAAVGVTLSLTARVDARRRGPGDRLIRPPGALPEEPFLDQCLRCGLCMGACMTHTIQPSLWEGGWEGGWTPRLDLRLAPCEQHCNLCGQVCPTGAIRPLPQTERIHAKIGTAMIKRERCLVWEQDKVCLVCDEICPYDAIEFREVDGLRRPFVTETRCNGCGQCEYKCPVEGESAIVVVRMGEMRLAKGSYRLEAQRRGYLFTGARQEAPEVLFPSKDQKLPPGFLLDRDSQ